MPRASVRQRLISCFLSLGVALTGCTSENAPPHDGAGRGGSISGMGGSGGAGTAGSSSGGNGTGGSAGVALGGSAGATAGGSAGAGAVAGAAGAGGSMNGGAAGSAGTAGAAAAAVGGSAGAAGSGRGEGGRAGEGGTSGASGAGGSSGSGAGGSAGSGIFMLTSPTHAEGAEFADEYTCAAAGFDGSLLPELHWSPGPAGTMSYAITFIDITLTEGEPPSDLGYHWVIWNIPASTLTLPEAFKMQDSIGANENRDYLGPCPYFSGTPGDPHTYEFTIYALSSAMTTISPTTGTAAVKDAEMKLEASNLAKARLTGTSTASPP
jgi:phosphatidylethanolamine-binding protein (PEBP) family uncharacterized protein